MNGCVTFYNASRSFVIRALNLGHTGDQMRQNWNGTLEYSTDGSTWSTYVVATQITSVLNDGVYKVFFRGTGITHFATSSSAIDGTTFTLYGYAVGTYVEGNIENLLDYQTVLNGQHPTMDDYCLANLFNQSRDLDFELELPATTLSKYCYSGMFRNSHLTQPPVLPATTLAEHCYDGMFSWCPLTSVPVLPATTLAPYCYSGMFSHCTGITDIPLLPATGTLPRACYSYMFDSCSNIKVSETYTGNYIKPFRIPAEGTAQWSSGNNWTMFGNTGGTFTGLPNTNQTYYLYVTDGKSLSISYDGSTIFNGLAQPPVDVTYNNATITTVGAGETKTLDTDGCIMLTDVIVGGVTLECEHNIMSANVTITVKE